MPWPKTFMQPQAAQVRRTSWVENLPFIFYFYLPKCIFIIYNGNVNTIERANNLVMRRFVMIIFQVPEMWITLHDLFEELKLLVYFILLSPKSTYTHTWNHFSGESQIRLRISFYLLLVHEHSFPSHFSLTHFHHLKTRGRTNNLVTSGFCNDQIPSAQTLALQTSSQIKH